MKTMSTLIKEFNDLLELNFKRPVPTIVNGIGKEILYSFYEMTSRHLDDLNKSKTMVGISSLNLTDLFQTFLEKHSTKNTEFRVYHRNRNDFIISHNGESINFKFKSKDITVREGNYSFTKKTKQIFSIELIDKDFEELTFLDVIEKLKSKKIEKENFKISNEQLKLNKKIQDEKTFDDLLINHNMSREDFQIMLKLYNNFIK